MINITKLVAIKEIGNNNDNAYRTFTIDIKYGVEDGYYTAESPIKVAVLSREEKTTSDSGTCIITRTKDTSIREATIDGETTPLVYVDNLSDDEEVIHILEALANRIHYKCRTLSASVNVHQADTSTPVSAHQTDTTDTDDTDDMLKTAVAWNDNIKLNEQETVIPGITVVGQARLTLSDAAADKIKQHSELKPYFGLRYDEDSGTVIVTLYLDKPAE